MKAIWVVIALLLISNYPLRQGELEVYEKKTDDEIIIYAKNSYPYTVTMEMELDLDNLLPSKVIPVLHVLSSGADEEIVALRPKEKSKNASYATKYFYYMGDVNAVPDTDYEYRLPYRLGSTHKVTQGYDGTFSHQGDVRYALDFNLDEGTPVYAARGGVVAELRESSNNGGASEDFIDRANFVTVFHSDGTFTDYSHLRQNGVAVTVGQKVRVGQLLGYSGSTGYVSGPHLHFNVKKVLRGGRYQTIPVKFRTRDGVVTLQEGESYQAY